MKPKTRYCATLRKATDFLLAVCFLAVSPFAARLMAACTEPPAHPGIWWCANGHTMDLMGNADGQTPFGMGYLTNSMDVYGNVDAAFDFDGTQRRVSIPNMAILGSESFTIELNVQFRGTNGMIFVRSEDPGRTAYSLSMVGPRTVRFFVGSTNGGCSVDAQAPSNSPSNTGTEIAATYNRASRELRLYFDGELAASAISPDEPWPWLFANDPSSGIGNYGGTTRNAPFDGVIDDVFFYTRVLSDAEIYTWRSPGRCARKAPPFFTLQPTNTTVMEGFELVLAVALEGGTDKDFVQWMANAIPIPGETNRVLRIQNVTNTHQAVYAAVATNAYGLTRSHAVQVLVVSNWASPRIIDVPSVFPSVEGSWTCFGFNFAGDTPMGFIWSKNGIPVHYDTAPWYCFMGLSEEDEGIDSVTITNAYGSATSADVMLTVLPYTNCPGTPPGAVAWWPGEWNGEEKRGGIPVYTDTTTAFAEGKVGTAFNFPWGARALVVNATHDIARQIGSGFTVEAWVRPINYQEQGIVSQWNPLGTAGGRSFSFALDAGSRAYLALSEDGYGISATVSTTNGVPQNVWTHLAATYDGQALRIYKDGVQQAVTFYNGGLAESIRSITVGGMAAGEPDRVFKGLVDEPTIYRRALLEFEIRSIYDAGSGGKCGITPVLAPLILQSPNSMTVTQGQAVNMKVLATGEAPLTYQWRFGGTNLPGAYERTLSITNAQPSHEGVYSVHVRNTHGEVLSQSMRLTVVPPEPPIYCASLPSGATVWWSFDAGLEDTIAGVELSNTGGAAVEPGVAGKGYAFFGTNGAHYLTASPGSTDVGSGGSMTIEMWIKPWNLGVEQVLLEWGSGLDDLKPTQFLSIVESNKLGAISMNFVDAAGVNYPFSSKPRLATNEWQHIAVTYNRSSGEGMIYFNGTLVGTANLGSFTPLTSHSLSIGHRAFDPSFRSQFQGVLDELTLYRGALTHTEVQAIYAAGSYGKCVPPSPPNFARQPASQQLWAGDALRLEAEITGTRPLHYQWYKNGEEIPGATSRVLAFTNVSLGHQGAYSVGVTNAYGWAVSANAQVSVLTWAPTIMRQPVLATVVAGETVEFSVEVSGTPPLRYTWLKDGVQIPGGTNSSLVISNVSAADAGLYWVQVMNDYRTVESSVASLVVTEISPNCVQAPAGLLTWWRGESNAADQIGYLPSYSNTTTFAPGKVGYAFHFDGVQDTVTNQSPGLTNVLDNYSYEFWAKPTAGRATTPEQTQGLEGDSGQRYAIFPMHGTAGVGGSGVSVGTNGVSVFEHGDDYLSSLLVHEAANSDWVHVTVVYSNRQPSLYLNGGLVRTGLRSTRPSFPSTFLGMNNAMTSDYGHYAGLLDEVSIYDRSLSPDEVERLYLAGSAGKCIEPLGAKPLIVEQPVSLVVTQGQAATLRVVATGAAPLHYYWTRNQSALPGGTNAIVALRNAQPSDEGAYQVRVTNRHGVVWSSVAQLGVMPGPAPHLRVVPLTNVPPGNTFYVPIELGGRGVESAMTFSLGYPTNLMRFEGLRMGSNTTGALSLVNTNMLNRGMVGIGVASETGSAFSPGVVVLVGFEASTSQSPGTAAVTFVSTPLRMEMVDTLRNPVPASFIAGTVTFAGGTIPADPGPLLNIQVRDKKLSLRWPAWASDWLLESTDDPAGGAWAVVPGEPTVTTDACAMELPVLGESRFYRMRKK